MRRPLLLRFEPPAAPDDWHMTGNINWPCVHESYGVVPSCEWASEEGVRIWLPAQCVDLGAEPAYRAEGRWRELAIRSLQLLADIARRSCDPFFGTTLCYLQLAARRWNLKGR